MAVRTPEQLRAHARRMTEVHIGRACDGDLDREQRRIADMLLAGYGHPTGAPALELHRAWMDERRSLGRE